MEFLTNDKLTIVGAAGMIGSNMAQTALMMRLTPNICLYDPYAPALEGVAEELYHCAFEGVNITWTSDVKEALSGAAYVVSSGGAARKAGMTREDLLKGNAEIAAQFGKDIKAYCPDVKHVVVVFNPADITGLVTLIYAGIRPSQLSTLAALDSTRLRSELAKYFRISPDEIRNCRTYGGHGEQMAVFASTTLVAGRPLSELIGREMPEGDWHDLQQRVIQGGKHIIDLRGRSSFQSPAYLSICMIAAAMGGRPFGYPAGVFVHNDLFKHILMAMETEITKDGVSYKDVQGTAEENKALADSYGHLCKLRDEVISMGIIPPVDVLPSLSRLKDKGIGEGKTRADHADTMNQLFAAYSAGKDAKELATILGESALSPTDRLYAKFAEEFEQRYVSQGYEENRSIEETLNIGWELLSILPETELKRIKPEFIEKYLPKKQA